MKDETTTIEVNRIDVRLARRIRDEMGCKSLKDLFHVFVNSYFAVKVGESLVKGDVNVK